MGDEWLDDDGYPTDAALDRLKNWPYQDANGALDFAASLWKWPDWVTRELSPAEREVVHADDDDQFVRFATGGWSGNESVILALDENVMVTSLTWCLDARGGLHIYRRRPTEGKK